MHHANKGGDEKLDDNVSGGSRKSATECSQSEASSGSLRYGTNSGSSPWTISLSDVVIVQGLLPA